MNNPNSIEIQQSTLKRMLSSRIWMMIIGIFILLYGLLCGLAVILVLFVSPWTGWESFFPTTYILLLVIPNLIFMAIMIAIGILLIRYAVSIKDFADETISENFSRMISRQKAFWKTSGIVAVVIVAISIIVILIAFIPALISPTMPKPDQGAILEPAEMDCDQSASSFEMMIRAGIGLLAASNMVESGSNKPEYPDQLDSASDGPAGKDNPFFDKVLSSGVTDGAWTKKGLTYTFTCNDSVYVYKYNPAEGVLLKE